MLTEEDIEALDIQAERRGIPRMYLLREVIERYLSGPDQGTAPTPAEAPGLSQALTEAQADRQALRVRVEDLEKALSEKGRDLEWTRGQLQTLTATLNTTIQKLPDPRPALTEAGQKPSWWARVTGRGETPPPGSSG